MEIVWKYSGFTNRQYSVSSGFVNQLLIIFVRSQQIKGAEAQLCSEEHITRSGKTLRKSRKRVNTLQYVVENLGQTIPLYKIQYSTPEINFFVAWVRSVQNVTLFCRESE